MKRIRSLIVLPKLCACYAYDAWRFFRAAQLAGNPFKSRAAAKGHLLRLSHALEKGMALPEPKSGFGKDKAQSLLCAVDSYMTQFGPDQISKIALDIVDATFSYHKRHGIDWPEIACVLGALQARQLKRAGLRQQPVGTEYLTREQIIAVAPNDPDAFFELRRSVRQFSAEPVSREEIERAVRIAQRAPSVCNRQGVKVYVYTDPAERKRVLEFQDGNVGFGNHGSVVFIVVADMSIFYKNGERNQGFVDGGLFAMTLALALHSLGLGSCMLNWSMGAGRDLRMRRELGIPDNEIIVTLIVAGKLKSKFAVAVSPRRPLDEVLNWRGIALRQLHS